MTTSTPVPDGSGIKFSSKFEIHSRAVESILKSTVSCDVHITLKIEGNPRLSASPLSSPLQELTERLLKTEIKSDYVLAADNWFEMACHKSFLAAHCPTFEKTFEDQPNEPRKDFCKLNLSEEGLKALLEFVYCLKLDIPREKSSVAIELFEIGIKKGMPILTKALNDLLVGQQDDWFEFDAALKLFLHSIKNQGYEDLKSKAVRAMKLKREEMETSALCQQLLTSDPKTTLMLLKYFSLPE